MVADKMVAERDEEASPTPINLRTNFDALAVFAPRVKTDSNGKATVNVKLPDNLTRYRITAVSVDTGKRFGKGESNLTARQPLMVRPSAPRFMNFGDKVELPVVVQNQTDKDMSVDVAIRATNATLTPAMDRPGTTAGRRCWSKPTTARKYGSLSRRNRPERHVSRSRSRPANGPTRRRSICRSGRRRRPGVRDLRHDRSERRDLPAGQTPGEVWPQFGASKSRQVRPSCRN
ncbi:MAG: hypothetical protein IPJ30_14315 [Acidobacteria bacterium]|nr:hypothetical protein [Acidobacteriota bacterium]